MARLLRKSGLEIVREPKRGARRREVTRGGIRLRADLMDAMQAVFGYLRFYNRDLRWNDFVADVLECGLADTFQSKFSEPLESFVQHREQHSIRHYVLTQLQKQGLISKTRVRLCLLRMRNEASA